MVKTVVKGVRLPDSLFHLVMSCNPDKNFSQIINDLLIEKYSFSIPCKQEETISGKQEEIVEPNFSIEEIVDKLPCAQDKKRRF